MSLRSILCVDGDDFFASVARLKDPALRNRPLIIGYLQSHGSVVSGSYETRGSGVQRGISMLQAKRMCPEAQMVQIDWEAVHQISRLFLCVIARYSPVVEATGVDSAFIDYTGCHNLFGSSPDFAVRLRNEIREKVSMSVSIGLSADKTVSAVACQAAKKGTLERVEEGRETTFLSTCPIQWLPGITPRLDQYFSNMSIRTIGELACLPVDVMEHLFGSDGRILALRARGHEGSRVRPGTQDEHPAAVTEFREDEIDTDLVIHRLAVLSSELCDQLRRTRLSTRCVILRITYSDRRVSQLQTLLNPPSNRDPEVFRAVRDTFLRLYRRRNRVRGIQIQARHMKHCHSELPFGDGERRCKWDKALAAIDQVHRRQHRRTVFLGTALCGSGLESISRV